MMATINKNIVKPKRVEWRREAANDINYYRSVAWQQLRNMYVREHPVCEECLRHGIVTAATEVHHLFPFMNEKTEEARWNTFLNESNLIAVCSACHYGFHYKLRHNHLKEARELSDEEWQQAKQMYDNEYYVIENE